MALSSRQKHYLQAMGIPLWEARRQLPGEKPLDATDVGVSDEAIIDEGNESLANDEVTWDLLKKQVASCTACALHESRTNTVFGVGDENADLLIIGEAPGRDEDRQGEPFVGKAGQLLNQMLQAIGFSRDKVFIANILKCRPPNNRDPRPEEVVKCANFLLAQIRKINPKVILSVGRVSAQNLLQKTDRIGRLRGQVYHHPITQTPIIVTYHPAYLLRSPTEKQKSWNDLLLASSTLEELQ